MSEPGGRRLALLVANDNYDIPGLPPLYAPVNDATQLRELLRDPEIGGFDRTDLLVNDGKYVVEVGIERLLRDAGPHDVVLLYFSGHGIRTRQNLYLATSNTDRATLSSTAVSAGFIKELIRDSAAAAKIILLDCCYSGAFLGSDAVKSTVGVDDVGEQLASGEGIYVLTASSSVEIAEDGRPSATQAAPLSVFTEAMLLGIGSGRAAFGSTLISLDDLWRFTQAEVARRTTRQSPSKYGFVRQEIYIARVRGRHTRAGETGGQVPLGRLLGPMVRDPERGLRARESDGAATMIAPIGQERRADGSPGEIVWLDLSGNDGNLVVAGRSGTGKSTLLRTLVSSLALTHTPHEVQFFVLEDSNRLGSLSDLPHVVDVAGDDQPDRATAILRRMVEQIRLRKRLYRDTNIDSPASLRSHRQRLPGGPTPDLLLVIDRWHSFAAMPEFAESVRELASAGPEYGIHVAATIREWADTPDWLAELFPTHVELRLRRPQDSRVDPALAAQLPVAPGWALYEQRQFRVAVPQLEEPPDAAEAEPIRAVDGDGGAELAWRVAQAWQQTPLGAWDGPSVPRFPSGDQPAARAAEVPDFETLHGIDLSRDWVRPLRDRLTAPDRLRVPFAVAPTGETVVLDLKESALGGMGPHGLLVGSTGSGKSELLRTLVLGLAATHPPETVNFALVDFKGGATFVRLDDLPHTAAVVTNLTDDLAQVGRLQDALTGELLRRQELLRTAGGYSSAYEYERDRAGGAALVPLPSLLVVIDEFSELLRARPEFTDVLIMIGRLGRSLGVHLLLAAQRLDEGGLSRIEANLSYRIGLRTFSAMESRGVLGIPDAYELPAAPGNGYLRADPSTVVRFRATYVSGPSRAARRSVDGPVGGDDRSVLDAVVGALTDAGPRARPVWLPPLAEPPTLDQLLPPEPPGGLRVPVALVDRPAEQRQDPLWLDLSGAAGHVLIVGAPLSGKSTLLRDLVAAVALTHTPEQAQFYCLDLAGGALRDLAGLPHVGSVAGRRQPDLIRRTVAELEALLAAREKAFAEQGIEAMPAYRLRPRDSADPYGDVFLVVDGWGRLRTEFDALESRIMTLAARGLSYGLHVVITAQRSGEVRPALRDIIGTRLELRLGDPMDSEVGRREAANVPAESPGRGLTTDKLHFLAALPRVDGDQRADTLSAGLADLVAGVARSWPGARAPAVKVLPTVLRYDELPPPAEGLIPVGLDEDTLRPVHLDFAADPHFVIFGAGGAGKTNLLRAITTGIAAQHSADEARIIFLDYRYGLLDVAGMASKLAHGFSPGQAVPIVREVVEAITERLPPADVTPEQLRARDWWSGPELYLVIDDYDLVATGSSNPVLPLLDLVAQARHIGLHIVLARAMAGAGRAMYEPILQRLREVGTPALIMSGSKEEGVLFGNVRPEEFPPGRGRLTSRRGIGLVQTALLPGGERDR
jgi:DNA segregation ATPase FtsK/SpoIIIE, S-DNA-T family